MPKKLPPGIEWDESRGKYRASVYESGKRYRLGRFDTLIDAKAARSIARADVARGIFVPPSARRAEAKREAEEQARAQTTVDEVAEDWLADFERQVESGQRKPATLRDGIKIAVIYSYDEVKRGKIKSIYPIRATR